MPRGGHNALPSNVKVLHGETRPSRVKPDEPRPDELVDLSAPVGLDRYAKEAWEYNAPKLAKLGLLTEIDRNALAAYCTAYSRWRRANIGLKAIKNDDPDEFRKYAITAEKAEQGMRLFQNEFGMTPASRSRLSVDSGETSDPLAEWENSDRRSS